ncbi:MAG: terminase family protein [Clostridiales bacterium]|nr:terminase family protein [Clostridiales bacterium]
MNDPGLDKIQFQEFLTSLETNKQNNKLQFYLPFDEDDVVTENADAQAEFHASHAKNRWAIAGNRSGKTVSGAAEACFYTLGKDGERFWDGMPDAAIEKYSSIKTPNDGWVVASDHNVQKEASQKWIMKLLPKHFIDNVRYKRHKILDSIDLTNGSNITFKSTDAGAKSFEGAAKRYIWFDEEPKSESVYDECLMRESGRFPLDLWGTMTPAQGIGFTHKRVYEKRHEDEDIEVFEWATMDNPYLPEDVINGLKRQFEDDEDKLKRRLHGIYIGQSGMVYPMFDEEKHLIEPYEVPATWPLIEVIDLGFANPSAVLYIAVAPGDKKIIIDEIYETKLSIPDLAQKIKQKRDEGKWCEGGKYKPVFTLIDPSAQQRQQPLDDRNIDEEPVQTPRKKLKQYGIPTKLADNALLPGINNVRSELKPDDGEPRLKAFNTCNDWIYEINHYRLREHRSDRTRERKNPKEKPRQKDDHLMDCTRYVINEGVRHYERGKKRYRGKPKSGSYSKTGY